MITTKIDWRIALKNIRRMYQIRAFSIKWNFIGKLNEFAELFTFFFKFNGEACSFSYSIARAQPAARRETRHQNYLFSNAGEEYKNDFLYHQSIESKEFYSRIT